MIDKNLSKYIPETGIILIIGERGSGKTVLGFSILEYIYETSQKKCFLYTPFDIPLPEWITVTNNLEFENNSCILIDESHITFFSRSHSSNKNIFISKLNNLVRHKSLLLVYITQDTAKIDVNILRSADVLMTKRINTFQTAI